MDACSKLIDPLFNKTDPSSNTSTTLSPRRLLSLIFSVAEKGNPGGFQQDTVEIRDEIPSLLMMCLENDTATATPAPMEKSQPRVPHHRYPTGAELGIPGDTAEIRVFYPKISTPESNDSRTEVKPVLGHSFGVGEQGWWDGVCKDISHCLASQQESPSAADMEHSRCHIKVISP